MIGPRPSAVDMPHSSPPSLAIPAAGHTAAQLLQCNGTYTLSASLVRHAHAGDEVRRIPDTRPVAVRRCSVSRTLGLQSVFAAGGSGQRLGKSTRTLPRAPLLLLDPLEIKISWARLGSEGCPLGCQNSSRPANTSQFRRPCPSPSVTANPPNSKLQTSRPQT